jgi:two-component system response regulator VicR
MNATLIDTLAQVSGADLDIPNSVERKRILIIDDDVDFVEMLKMLLREAGFDVCGAYNHISALQKCTEVNPDVILLDIMMPDVDGWEVYRRLRQLTKAPLIFVSAAPREENACKGLDLGADDFISKPFYNTELVARIKKVVQRAEVSTQWETKDFPGINLHIDLDAREVHCAGYNLHLLPREFDLLKILADYAPRNVTYEKLTTRLWGEDSTNNRAHLKTLVFSLRKKLQQAEPITTILVNNRGIGYQLITQPLKIS